MKCARANFIDPYSNVAVLAAEKRAGSNTPASTMSRRVVLRPRPRCVVRTPYTLDSLERLLHFEGLGLL
ncbi:hypothetical protein C5167_034272 [Papaver somniferum]|uniref:Uncharacterized protein n=1 Tax=Papaver somniferum TaxID=3469 RepID=A0A4Y7KE32_PAPSO|nr:hypothetical protein C5167_034272 [Papaver somniferum]